MHEGTGYTHQSIDDDMPKWSNGRQIIFEEIQIYHQFTVPALQLQLVSFKPQ